MSTSRPSVAAKRTVGNTLNSREVLIFRVVKRMTTASVILPAINISSINGGKGTSSTNKHAMMLAGMIRSYQLFLFMLRFAELFATEPDRIGLVQKNTCGKPKQ